MTSNTSLRRIGDFVNAGLVPQAAASRLEGVVQTYAAALTPALYDLIDRNDPDDPIARQFVPTPLELVTTPDERTDPIGDKAHAPVKGLVHRYPDRVLLTPVHVCPVYCRFCFRRAAVGPGAEALTEAETDRALEYIASDPQIFEVILTGGDPLMLSARRMAALIRRLAQIGHVQVLRIHTRVPIAEPDRINAGLISALAADKAVWMSVHCNHARELGRAQTDALARLSKAGIPLLSQTVLLKGVNDNAADLAELFRALIARRVKPYYLHHPDFAPGTSHFRLTIAEGQALIRRLWTLLPGPARPTYVVDLPGGHGKVSPTLPGLIPVTDSIYQASGLDGETVTYPPGRVE